MGPIIILDKSAFQSLSWREHVFLDIHFMESLTPILGLELLGDLRKEGRGTRTAEEIVTDLARKFGGSGPATSMDYRKLCIASLLGHDVPLDGRIVPQAQTPVKSALGKGLLIDLSPLNEAILRWSDGRFDEFEREFAGFWRETTRSLDQESLVAQLERHNIVVPKADSLDELAVHVDTLLGNSRLQDVWLRWMLEQLDPYPEHVRAIRARWKAIGGIGFKRFSPITHHCMRVLLLLIGATRHSLVRWLPTNVLDIQYLYYAPFCMVFCSDDRLHRSLAPHVLRADQSFVTGADLKSDLRRLADWRDGLSDQEQSYNQYALGGYPPPASASIVYELWKTHMRPWSPGSGNQATNLTDEEKRAADSWALEMFKDVEDDDFQIDV